MGTASYFKQLTTQDKRCKLSACAYLSKIMCIILLIAIISLSACSTTTTKPVINAAGNSLAILTQTADSAYHNEDWETAEKAYYELTQNKPAQSLFWFRLANVYVFNQRLARAENAYYNALKHTATTSPQYATIAYNLAVLQLQQATRTFMQLSHHSNTPPKLAAKAKNAVNAIADLIAKDFVTTVKP